MNSDQKAVVVLFVCLIIVYACSLYLMFTGNNGTASLDFESHWQGGEAKLHLENLSEDTVIALTKYLNSQENR